MQKKMRKMKRIKHMDERKIIREMREILKVDEDQIVKMLERFEKDIEEMEKMVSKNGKDGFTVC